jgi:hypothetical protein
MAVPTPRIPRCLAHHVHLASCTECQEQRTAERAAARARLERIRLEAGAL